MQQLRAAVFVGLVAVSSGLELRRSGNALELNGTGDPATPEEIHEKYDKMDEFLKVMFTMACKWKHGKDVNGLAAEKLKDEELKPDDVADFKAKTQKANVQQMSQACGHITGQGKQKCRQSCADRWGIVKDKRAHCDGLCVTAYANFEASCKSKEENLVKVYEMKLAQAAARKACYEGKCKGFPTVWMKEDKEKMETERTKVCEGQCTEDGIKNLCKKKWMAEADFFIMPIQEKCFNEGKAKSCYEEKSGELGTEQETCSTDGQTKCGEEETKCKEKGKADANFKAAEEFCVERKKMCEEQVVDKCLKEHEKALDGAKNKCEEEDAGALKKCEDEGTDKKKKEEVDKCKADLKTTCPDKCAEKCPVDELETCLKNLESDHDATQDFCEDFWRLLHESSETDPMSGNPIVLLAEQ